ncbi:hypothetical protein [Paenibacillus sp. CF384]|uniref:hypothetical protein n=1 Tax=Paenibacillus sp. CF384 TaxID=1884382 RepID=UPI0008951767|nr:hypothetical protein [Paenibacillus sp. CF384]SDW58818.1 hypothetical protein SAMN05518855_1003206 [Paenibacillus sp. CF384]
MNVLKWSTCCVIMLTVIGCNSAVDNKSPGELLSLSVSGLSGVDQYAFRGDTGIGLTGVSPIKAMSFQGTVENHNNVLVKATNPNSLGGSIHPLEYLREVENSAQSTELVPSESGNRTAVLRITSNEAKAKATWVQTLRDEFSVLEKKVPAASSSKNKMQSKRASGSVGSLEREWNEELSRSKAQLEAMLSTLRVQSSCRMIIDRKKLLPIQLEEKTTLQYKAEGQDRKELRVTKIVFTRLGGGQL